MKLAAACGLVLGLPAALMGTILGLLLQLLFHLGVVVCAAYFLKGRCGLHIQWLRSWPLDTLSLIMFSKE